MTSSLFHSCAAALLVCTAASAPAQEAPALRVGHVVARFDIRPRTGVRRDSLTVEGRLLPSDPQRGFQAATDAVRVAVSGVDVFASAPPADPKAFRVWKRRGAVVRWRLRARGPSGSAGIRTLTASARTGAVRLAIRNADLRAVRDGGTGAKTVSLTLGGATFDAAITLRVVRSGTPTIWRYDDLPPIPRPPGPLTFASLATGSLVDTSRPDAEVARDATAFAAIWTALGNPGPLPQVDFEKEMVVVVSALVVGPGSIPPGLQPISVRDTGTGVEVEWRLSLCEEPNQCPGAPGVICPTATPWHVLRTAATPGGVTLSQKDTVWVCP